VLARVRDEFTGVKGFVSANRLQASMYYFGKNLNMDEALRWAESAITGKPFGQSGFDAYENLATGYEKMNRTKTADSVMNEGLVVASLSQHTGYGRKLIARKRIDRAEEIMLRAQTRFGDIYAVNNGLSYVYSAKGDFKKALDFAHKALAQAPPSLKPVVTANIEKLKAGKDIN
jgi:tetratricopeptide (TPR) repeat protein